MIKESRISPSGVMTTADGVGAIQTDRISSNTPIFDVPLVLEQYGSSIMSKLDRLDFFVDMTTSPTVASWVVASVHISGYYFDVYDSQTAYLWTSYPGHLLMINSTSRTGAPAPPAHAPAHRLRTRLPAVEPFRCRPNRQDPPPPPIPVTIPVHAQAPSRWRPQSLGPAATRV